MSETKFTKGPWVANFNGSWYQINAVIDSENFVYDWIADTCASSCSGDLPLGEANAHLIATAPEMYDMLEDAADLLFQSYEKECRDHGSEIRKLLAKARGEL